jgi:hypothetical protein
MRAFSIQHSAVSIQHSALSGQHSAFSTQSKLFIALSAVIPTGGCAFRSRSGGMCGFPAGEGIVVPQTHCRLARTADPSAALRSVRDDDNLKGMQEMLAKWDDTDELTND